MTTYSDIAKRMPEQDRAQVVELAQNVAFMRGKLRETRRLLADQQVVMDYDNGGGQTGVRRNPAFDAYEALLRSYTAALGELRGMLDGYTEADAGGQPAPLKIVGNSKWKRAAGG